MKIFDADSSNSKMFQSGKARATFGDAQAILIGVTVGITRQISPIPTLTDGVVWSGQPAMGTVSAQSILVSTSEESRQLVYQLAGPKGMCEKQPIELEMTNSCDSRTVSFSIKDAYCTAIEFSASGAQGYVGQSFTAQFTECDINF